LGFGWIYYALIRNLRPEVVIAIGSCRGFMPFCAARAVKDNQVGEVIFIDPSYSGIHHPGWGGEGAWNDPAEVALRFADYGLEGWITHLKLTSREALATTKEIVGSRSADIVIIDGAHTYENSLQDFELYSSLVHDGFVLFHDSTNRLTEVPLTIQTIANRGFPNVTVHRDVGLTIVEITSRPDTASRWPYLTARSNRANLLLPFARSILRAGDTVMEVYCGYSQLASLLDDVRIFGWDRDQVVIETLRRELPQHRWEQIDERQLLFASCLPDEIDVIIGLGLSRGSAEWDPHHVLDNIRYLLGRYLPRACLFETALDYLEGTILNDLSAACKRLGYSIDAEVIVTDLPAFPRRGVLIAQR
jgi:methyltransferase family protein